MAVKSKGGNIYFPELGLMVSLQPEDFVIMRRRVITHGIERWKGGQRISIPHFTHTSV